MPDRVCDVLVVGAGCGGVAAAVAAARLGRRVVLAEPTAWVGGQLTAQAVPPDEHPWVETTGTTAAYRRLRTAVRDTYRGRRALTDAARRDPHLNPGLGWVSRLCAEPVVFHDVLRDLLHDHERRDGLDLLLAHRAVRVDVTGDRVEAVTFRDVRSGDEVTVSAAYVLDATEEGDLLPLACCEHVLGAEPAAETGEPHALDGPGDPSDQQAITWCAALEWRPGEDHTIDRPDGYAFWSGYQAPHWPGPQLGWATAEPETGRPLRRPLFGQPGEQDLWTFRRIRYGGHYAPPRPDVTLVNWPHVDYWLAPLTGRPEDERAAALAAARDLTLSFVHWLQTDAPRPDGGTGYPGLRLCGDVVGTPDGLAAAPYIRESRRIRAETTVVEQHIGVEARPGAATAESFADTVGVGCYRIDLHPSTAGHGYLDIATYPFQIPLGALLPVRLDNLLAAGKNLGVTHVTNGCYRLHPVEWNVGESAGTLAAFSLDRGVPPRAVRSDASLLADLQSLLVAQGVQLHWPEEIRHQQR
ncbi:MAG TPA: FAD-dependent oxidoreductase [Candidatus Eisenbacteria bacterium]|nr:FAD-dependent oxidoreductase [Candidatus Eisenbacteria bacterium]